MNDALRALLRLAPRAGFLNEVDGEFVTGGSMHRVCGDAVEFDLRLEGDRIVDLAWRAEGCPAVLAVAAAAGDALVGSSVDQVAALLHERVAACGGLAAHEQHAEKVVLRALGEAIEGSA